MKCKYIFLILTIALNFSGKAQTNRKLTDFPELVMTDIPGAPKLGMPVLVIGSNSDVISQGHGLAAPAVWDWNTDGLQDLLIGEFGSGIEFERYVGNFIRVYLNVGTDVNPEFDGKFIYARLPFRFPGNGTPLSVDQFCCMGFTPQFIDLNADGYQDIVTGQYQGEVSWFRGVAEGFLPGEPLTQVGNPRDPIKKDFKMNQPYWLYSSASFGDFTNDDLVDLVVGGPSIRISKNIGTATTPDFAKRELLLDVDGNPLKVYEYPAAELKERQQREIDTKGLFPVPPAGDNQLSPYVVDWDNDGVLDLLVTNSYAHQGLATVSFFKGVKVNGDQRFQKEVPLFITKSNEKAFPGSGPRVFVTDWNNDGVNDLLIGTSVVTMLGKFNSQLSWSWEENLGLHGAGKDPALLSKSSESQLQWYKQDVKLPSGITIDDYMTIRHQGYVYVMLGTMKTASLKIKK